MVFGTNLFIIIFTSISSCIGHQRNNNIFWKAVYPLAGGGIVGALVGSKVASIAPSFLLEKVFAVVLIYAASQIFFNIKKDKTGDPIFDYKFLIPVGILEGFVASLVGIGGGCILIPILILLFRFPIKKIAGTSSSIIIFSSIAATISYVIHGLGNPHLPGGSLGFVNYSTAIPVTIGTIVFAQLGVYVNRHLNTQNLKRVFGLFLFIIAIKMLFF